MKIYSVKYGMWLRWNAVAAKWMLVSSADATIWADAATAQFAIEAASIAFNDIDPEFEIVQRSETSVHMIADAEPARESGAPVADNSGGNFP